MVRAAWLLQPQLEVLQYRQELEALERSGISPSPLLSPEEAVTFLRRFTRCIGALTYGWLSLGNPDPVGARLRVVRQALLASEHIEGVFWDYASLFQHPPNGRRALL